MGLLKNARNYDHHSCGSCSNWIINKCLGPNDIETVKNKDPVAIGLALGGTGHAVGTGTAFKYGHVAGAMAGLAIGITGILYVFISPIVASMILS